VSIDEGRSVRRVIEQTAPGIPIRYVVLSHVHADHVAGLPAYGGAEVLVGGKGSLALLRQLQALPPTLREVTAPTTLDLGRRTVRVLPLPSAHAASMLVSYAPDARTIFQGDLFAVGRELDSLIRDRKLRPTAIVGVHGRTGSLAEFRRALALSPYAADRGGIGSMIANGPH
jgi:glyoxylase-like metal-dependent hydrolase (beta-lactamase superfamily II)